MLQFSAPNETSRLAQELALELIDQLKTPQWGLVNSLGAVDLSEALNKRFGVRTNSLPSVPGLSNIIPDANPVNEFQRQSAQIYYMAGLISQDRTQDAVAVAKKVMRENAGYL